jgi:IclR family transcriptional regulator, KDG regulon repressor
MSKPVDPEHPGRYSSSLAAGLAMLNSFTPEHPERGIADMAEELDMGRSTTHRYATTLVTLGYLEQGLSRQYRKAPG